MRGKMFAVVLASGLVAAPSAQAQKFWQKKDYQRWSKQECRELLTKSPWADSYTIGTVVFQVVGEESAVAGREMAPQITYLVRFLSARPIRQALVRQPQIERKYEELPPEQKQALDEQYGKFIAAEFPQTVLVQVLYSTNSQEYDRELTRYWQSQSPEALKQQIYLIGGPGRIAPLGVQVAGGAGGEIQLIFPREFEGRPMAGPDDKHLALEFLSPAIGILPSERVYIRFEIKKMKVDGDVIY